MKGMFHSNIPLTAPSRVTVVSVTKSVESGATLRVTWTPPQSDLTISQYEVEYKRSGTMSWSNVTVSGSPPATTTNLTVPDAGAEYNVRVRAVSEIGAGMWSAEQMTRTADSECFAHSAAIISSICMCGVYICNFTVTLVIVQSTTSLILVWLARLSLMVNAGSQGEGMV